MLGSPFAIPPSVQRLTSPLSLAKNQEFYQPYSLSANLYQRQMLKWSSPTLNIATVLPNLAELDLELVLLTGLNIAINIFI